MMRRARWLVLAGCLVVVVFFLQSWILDRQSETGSVGWSPLYDNRVAEALVPLTSQVAYGRDSVAVGAACDSAAAQCGTSDCQQTSDCEEGTSDCKETFQNTCEGSRTCEGYGGGGATTACATCAGDPDCETGGTVDGLDCVADTWDGPDCDASSVCPWECGGPTSRITCLGGGVFITDIEFDSEGPDGEDALCVPGPTYEGATCALPTCDGPTCEGPTCLDEDCEAWDFGDAPDFDDSPFHYETRLEDDGARHRFYGVYYLGNGVDPEMDGRPNAVATGDDDPEWTARDDEDGIWFVTTLVPGEPAVAIVHASRSGSLSAWIDYDVSGTWETPEESIFGESLGLAQGFNWVTFVVPDGAVPDVSFARFRFGSSALARPGGEADEGEVEDYQVPICGQFNAWVMTDDVFYRPGDEVSIRFYLGETSQVTLVQHFPDGSAQHLWTGTLEAGRHEFPTEGRRLRVEPAAGTTTVEMIATSLRSGCTSWLSTPYRLAVP